MKLSEWICSTAILDGCSSVGKEELLRQLLTKLAIEGHLDAADVPSLLEGVIRREQLGSTGIGRGIACPNCRHAAIERRIAILGVCSQPVEFESIDGEPADIFALILVPPERPGGYLKVFPGAEALMRQLGDERFTGKLRAARTEADIFDLLRAADGSE